MSLFWQALWKRLGTKLKMSTSFHPQTDGQTERANQTMEQVLRSYVSYDQSDWDDYLPLVEFAINNSVAASTGETPYFTNYGFHPRIPSSVEGADPEARSPLAIDFHVRLIQLQAEVRKRILEAQERQRKFADEKRSDYTFAEGDSVLYRQKIYQIDVQALSLTTPMSDLLKFSRLIPLWLIDWSYLEYMMSFMFL
jgi:hypothetical protein